MSRFPLRTSGVVALFVLGIAAASCAEGATDEVNVTPGGGDTGTVDEDTGGGGDETSVDSSVIDTGSSDDTGASETSTTDSSTGETSTDGGGTCASGCPAGKWDIDGDPLTGECGCEYSCVKKGTADPIDDKYTDDNCDGSDGIVEQCVYVSATSGDDTKAGTRVAPMKTVAAAIAKAKSTGVPAVCLSGETYSGLVTMESGVSVYGGFDEKDPDFKFKRSKDATTLLVNSGTVVFAPTVDVATHLEGLTIKATTITGGVGASTYGVRLGGGSGVFYVRYNKITVEDGTRGADGTPGAKGADGTKGADGGKGNGSGDAGDNGGATTPSSCGKPGGRGGRGGYASDGADGAPGTGGVPFGKGGAVSSGCFSTAGIGKDGGTLFTPGADGTPGGTSSLIGTFTSGAIYTPAVAPSGTDGLAGEGGGGGGGGGGGVKLGGVLCDQDSGGGGGAGGSGGCGGTGGGGGGGGGGSFGITAAGGELVVDGCDIQVGKGGAGGDGKGGGAPGGGSAGGAGGPRDGDDGNAGGNGGNGAAGGRGGPGAGGAGGPSVCVAAKSSVKVTFSVGLGANSCVNSGGGAGGLGGSNPSSTGAAGPTGFSGSSKLDL